MTETEIASNKERFISVCREHIRREGLDKMLDYLSQKDFFTAPSSTHFHLNEDGGLCLHSLHVFDTARKIYEQVALPRIKDGSSPFTEEIPLESIAIATLFHDICKVNLYHKAERWKKDERNKWVSYQGYEIRDEFPFGHGEKSCLMLSWYIRLKPEEMLAIRWHMGMYDAGEVNSANRRAFYEACERSLLVDIVSTADFLSSKIMEKTTER